MDQYFIHNLKKNYCKEINEDEFLKFREARNKLFLALIIEEKLEFLLMNYAEIEKEAFNITMSQISSRDYSWNRMRDSINILNIKVFNFLSTHKFYEDTVQSTLKSIYGRHSGEDKVIENKFLSEYNNPNLFYRTISIIRNYAQHCDLPINIMGLKNELIDTNEIVEK